MAKAKKKFESIETTTETFRASYLHVFQPKAYKDEATGKEGKPKYSVTMLFDKEAPPTDFKKKLVRAAKKAWGEKENWPENFKMPWRDGDKKKDAPGYENTIYCKADSDYEPKIVDQKKEDIVNERKIFSGCYCRAAVTIQPYEDIGGRSGLKLYLQGIQLVKKGESFGNRFDADSAFDEVEDEDGGSADDYSDDDSDDGEHDF